MTEIISIDPVTTQPHMNTWAPIRRNILTEDDQYHSNIPYFGDEAIGTNFIRSFEENVKNGVNIFDGDDEDSLFMTLVNNLSKIDLDGQDASPPSSEEMKKWQQSSSVDTSLPSLTVFQAIHSYCPDYATVEELIKKFRKLNEVRSSTNFVPDIDGPDVGESQQSAPCTPTSRCSAGDASCTTVLFTMIHTLTQLPDQSRRICLHQPHPVVQTASSILTVCAE